MVRKLPKIALFRNFRALYNRCDRFNWKLVGRPSKHSKVDVGWKSEKVLFVVSIHLDIGIENTHMNQFQKRSNIVSYVTLLILILH